MESYVVRIYRRNCSDLQDLIGLVELVDTDEQRGFTNFDELKAILDGQLGQEPEKKIENGP